MRIMGPKTMTVLIVVLTVVAVINLIGGISVAVRMNTSQV